MFLISLTLLAQGIGAQSADLNQRILKVWDFKNTEERTRISMTRVDRLFLEAHPGIRLEHIGFFDQEYIPALKAALLAGSGPDVLWIHHGSEFNEYSSYLTPLESYQDEDFPDIRIESLDVCRSREGRLMALPLTYQGMGWYYNKQIFSEAGLDPENPPTDWKDFLRVCEVLKSKGITPIATGNNRPLTTEFIRRSLISAFFEDDEIKRFYHKGWGSQTDRFRVIIEFIKELRDKDYFDPQGIFRSYFGYGADSFGSGGSAMMLGLISDTLNWKQFSDSLGKENIGYFPNLNHPGMSRPGAQLLQPAGIMVAINKDSENKEDAFAYIKHLFSQESQNILVSELGMMIPMKNLSLPEEEYPVLKEIKKALNLPALDPELFVPSVKVGDLQYRLDDLLINTKEISVNDYIQKMARELLFY
ncbi:ABC transporter substrate-binding protein [Oceanispirochaeta sp.]|uniref:ABC transporter substrate-binding protein n=1 Tax=Oceanispirochaeta sp. TaxID=2035350 RepID=UPI00260650E5|nr:extracellular solute-binding protein [Oceanispirochaeta sp.]MDA3956834.1 extracellular solute-binding protein [Oceanispirochaeta sp.]